MNIEILIPEKDDGKKKITVFVVDGRIVERKYIYGKGYGFLHLTRYPSLEIYKCRMSTAGSAEVIYGGLNETTDYGRQVEYELMKLK